MVGNNTIVAVRDPESVESLVRLACETAAGTGGKVTALHVVEIGPGLPLDADGILDDAGKEILDRAQRAAETFGLAISKLLIRAREAGPAIVAEAEERGAELLVMGYHGSHGLSEFLMGSTVKYVARHAQCRTIIQVVPPLIRQRVQEPGRPAVAVQHTCVACNAST
jgi:nucleotide-binding universal stress UspA family protein